MQTVWKTSWVLTIVALLLMSCNWLAESPRPTATLAMQFITPTPSSVAETASTITPTATLATASPTVTPTPTATATPTETPTVTPTPNLTPHAFIDSPSGSLNIRFGPGEIYKPPIGLYDNGAMVQLIGRQQDNQGNLWWLIPFASSQNNQGWIFADFTEAYNTSNLPWINPPPTPTPVIPTPVPTIRPQAIINSPAGFVQVKRGPGEIYDPPWGAYNNGAVVEVIGKQYATNNELWWLIPFNISPTGQGWIRADYTVGNNVADVPWVNFSPFPGGPLPIDTPVYGTPRPPGAPLPIDTPTYGTPSPTSPSGNLISWTVTGRVVDAATNRPVRGARVEARFGSDTILRATTADANGQFSLFATAPNQGDLLIKISASGYRDNSFNAGFANSRNYYLDTIRLTPTSGTISQVTWNVTGQVSEANQDRPIAGASVRAVLGSESIRLESTTDANGQFSMSGQARDEGGLELTIQATGYQTNVVLITNPQSPPRNYNLPDLQLVPTVTDCQYESVLTLSEDWAVARLQSLGFTEIAIQPTEVEDANLIGNVISQLPEPPVDVDQSVPLGCDRPIILSVGVAK